MSNNNILEGYLSKGCSYRIDLINGKSCILLPHSNYLYGKSYDVLGIGGINLNYKTSCEGPYWKIEWDSLPENSCFHLSIKDRQDQLDRIFKDICERESLIIKLSKMIEGASYNK